MQIPSFRSYQELASQCLLFVISSATSGLEELITYKQWPSYQLTALIYYVYIKCRSSGSGWSPRKQFQCYPELGLEVHLALWICYLLFATNVKFGFQIQTFSYRDEHSSPFGWKTRSQQNLHFDIYDSKVLYQEDLKFIKYKFYT